MKALKIAGVSVVVVGLGLVTVVAQNRHPTTADSVRGHFDSVNRRVLEMAKDFPEDRGQV
jgi:hypothetical protein